MAHKHAEVIKAWADGAEIQYRFPPQQVWIDRPRPEVDEWPWYYVYEYRVKPKPEPLDFIARDEWVRTASWFCVAQAVRRALATGKYNQ